MASVCALKSIALRCVIKVSSQSARLGRLSHLNRLHLIVVNAQLRAVFMFSDTHPLADLTCARKSMRKGCGSLIYQAGAAAFGGSSAAPIGAISGCPSSATPLASSFFRGYEPTGTSGHVFAAWGHVYRNTDPNKPHRVGRRHLEGAGLPRILQPLSPTTAEIRWTGLQLPEARGEHAGGPG